MFSVWQGIPGINPQVFPALTGERGYFLHFSTFETLDYSKSKTVQANPLGFIPDNKKGPLDKHAKFHWNTLEQTADTTMI